MALPKIDVPTFELQLPLSKKKVKFRPFLVKEEKILLMAMESGEEKTVLESVKQIINNCCVNDVNVDSLPVLDLEFFFLNLRARSVGEVVELQYKCNNKIAGEDGEEKTCGNLVKLDVNILEVTPDTPKNHTSKIELTDKLGMLLRYPTVDMVEIGTDDESSDVEKIMKIISLCVDCIYDDETIYHRKDIGDDEMKEFLENLTQAQFQKVQEFFNTIPKLSKTIPFECKKCGYKEEITVEGLQSFFG